MYPVLKPTVHMKRQAHNCQIKDEYTDNVTGAHPSHCMVLALCNGAMTVEDIAKCAVGLYGFSMDKAMELVNYLLEKHAERIYRQEEPILHELRYTMEDFAYTPKPVPTNGDLIDSPIMACLKLTSHCNFQCVYCYNSSSPVLSTCMSTEQWLDVVRQLADTDCFTVHLTGGEPMSHPGFFEIVKAINSSDMMMECTTNGSLLAEDAVARLYDYGQRRLMVSLDTADPEQFCKMTGSDSFYQVIGGIERLTKAGFHVDIKALLYPENYRGVGDLLRLISRLGAKGVMLDSYKQYYIGRGNERFRLNDEQCEYVRHVFDTELPEGLGGQFSPPDKQWDSIDDCNNCGGIAEGVMILADGSYCLCERLDGDPYFNLGRVQDLPIMDMWRANKCRELINPPIESYSPTCRECEVFDKCKSGCFGMKRLVNAGTFDPDPSCPRSRYKNNPLEVHKP